MIFIDRITPPLDFAYMSREINEFGASYLPLGIKNNVHYFLYISKEHIMGTIKIKPEFIHLNYNGEVIKLCDEEFSFSAETINYIYKWHKTNKFKEEVDLYESIKQIIKKIELIE